MSAKELELATCYDCGVAIPGEKMANVQDLKIESEAKSAATLDRIFQDVLKLPPSEIKDELTMNDVELWDSLRHMELILAIEQGLGLELSFEDITRMENLGAIRKIVAEKAAK